MILPNNGKVVIIDDQPKDVIELIAALSKEKVPFVHYREEDLSDLPDSPIENVRLIFLDLQLLSDTYMSAKDITGPIKTRLMKILKPKTPYALVIWSKNENKYKKALIDDFETEFKDYKPIFCTSLPKSDIIGKGLEGMKRIKKELEIEIANFKSFNAFLVWESIVNESSGKLTNDITTLYSPDNDWNKKSKYLLYKLAEAYSGKTVNSFGDIKQLKNALYTLTLSFTDRIENSIDKIIDESFSGLVSSTQQDIQDFSTIINRYLLISESSDNPIQPGNIFLPLSELEKEINQNDLLLEKKMTGIEAVPQEHRESASKGNRKEHSKVNQLLKERKAEKVKHYNVIMNSAITEEVRGNEDLKRIINESVNLIELVITPLCDYAQEKAELSRMLPGVIIPSKYRDFINVKSAYIYVSEANFKFDDRDSLLIFDFRFLYALNKGKLKNQSVKMRLKHQLLSDIQIKLGAHVNRTGVLYVN